MHPILFRIPLPHMPLKLWWALVGIAVIALAYAAFSQKKGDKSGAVFSFFVAVIIAPWLMIRFARKSLGDHGHHDAHGGKLGALYARVAPDKRAFLIATSAITERLVLRITHSFDSAQVFAHPQTLSYMATNPQSLAPDDARPDLAR